MRRAKLIGAVVTAVALSACGDTAQQPEAAPAPPTQAQAQAQRVLAPSEPFGLSTIGLRAPDGRRVDVPVYVADDGETRARGLMGRTELPREAGMVFLFDSETTGAFWMKDTLIPLSIAYFGADGRVLTVLDMQPCTTAFCPEYPAGTSYSGALEVNQGYFRDVGLSPGWTVELPPELRAS